MRWWLMWHGRWWTLQWDSWQWSWMSCSPFLLHWHLWTFLLHWTSACGGWRYGECGPWTMRNSSCNSCRYIRTMVTLCVCFQFWLDDIGSCVFRLKSCCLMLANTWSGSLGWQFGLSCRCILCAYITVRLTVILVSVPLPRLRYVSLVILCTE